MVEARDDRVIEGGFPTRGKSLQRGAQQYPVFREINRARQPGTDIFVEDDRKHLVFGVARFGEGGRSGHHHVPLGEHAGTVVNDQPHGDGHVARAEKLDVLRPVVLENRERALRQLGDRVTSLVEDVHVKHDELRA